MSVYYPRDERSEPSQKYRRPRRFFSITGVIIGLILGVAGGLYIAWEVAPVQEVDVEPWQLSEDDKASYIVAVALSYSYDGDLNEAVKRLLDLRLGSDPIQEVADVACQLSTSGYVNSTSGLRAVRSMMNFYQLQGRTGCADTLIEVQENPPTAVIQVELATPTPTLVPPDTKTPTPENATVAAPTPTPLTIPTSAPQGSFLAFVNTVCSATESGLIQVYVYEINGSTGIPGQRIRVRWDGGESIFFTGLMPERGPAYADFEMEEGGSYRVDMPGLSEPLQNALSAVPCNDPTTGERAIITYRVIFRPAF
jgi:hypothetical protein